MAGRIVSRLSSLGNIRSIEQIGCRQAATLSAFDIQHKSPVVRKLKLIPKAQYGGRHTVTMLPGGGIGPELMEHVREIFRLGGMPVDFEIVNIDPYSDGNDDLEYLITSVKRNGVAIKGNIETGSLDTGIASRNVALRNELDLFVNVLKCKSYSGVPARYSDLDIIIVRQNTEGEYAMLEHESVSGVVESMKIVTAENSERVARFAFEYAKSHGRKKVTTIHKANIMKLSDGLFLETSRRVAKDYPDIAHNDMIIDNCCMQLVSNPHQFDVMNMTNLYGTIVSNVICGLIGGAGLLSGRNYGDHYAVFETGTRNTGTSIAGKGIANPIAMLNAAVDMLEHLGHNTHAGILSDAIRKTVCDDKILTADLGGSATTADIVNNIKKYVIEETSKMKCGPLLQQVGSLYLKGKIGEVSKSAQENTLESLTCPAPDIYMFENNATWISQMASNLSTLLTTQQLEGPSYLSYLLMQNVVHGNFELD